MAEKLLAGTARTLFLHIPTLDWSAVRVGAKTEVRYLVGSKSGRTPEAFPYLPSPGVAYRTRYGDANQTLMVVIEAAWQEPLGSIAHESIRNEGCEDFAAFKQYWLMRRDAETPNGVRPEWQSLKDVNVVRFRPMRETDLAWAGDYLLHRLYGAYLEQLP